MKEKDGFELKRYSGGGNPEGLLDVGRDDQVEHQRVNIFYGEVKQKFRAAFLLGYFKSFRRPQI